MSLNLKGLDELRRKIEKVGGTQSITMDELLPTAFMTRHTNFSSFQEMMDQSGFVLEKQEDFDNIPRKEMDAFVRQNTLFTTWEEMLATAMQERLKAQLGF